MFVFLRCRKFLRRSHGSRLSALLRNDSICFYWNECMITDYSFWYTNHVQGTYKSCQRESKINHYNWFLSRGTSRLIKWIYKERYELLLLKRKQQLNNSLRTTKLKLMSCWAPFIFGISYECRTPILVDENNDSDVG